MLTKKEQRFITEMKRIAEVRLSSVIIEVEDRDGLIDILCYDRRNYTRQTYTKGSFEHFTHEEIFTGASTCIRNFINKEYVEVVRPIFSPPKRAKKLNKTILLCMTMKFIQHE